MTRRRRGLRLEEGGRAALAFRVARELESRSIGKGDRVMLWGDNCGEWVAAFFGIMLRGAVAVPMDKIASPDFAQRVAADVDAKLIICASSLSHHAGERPYLELENLSDAIAGRSARPYTPAPLSRDDTAQIVFTSGTTADPKGVVITHGNVLANIAPLEKEIRAYLKYERLVHPVRFLNLLPLSHVFGQFLGFFLPPLMGGTVIFQSELKPSEVMNTIRRERVSVLVSVPRVLQSLKHKVERDIEDREETEKFRKAFAAAKDKHFLRRWWMFRAIRRKFGWKFWAFISGGAALPEQTEAFWNRMGYAVIQGYGMTETASLISLNHPFRSARGS